MNNASPKASILITTYNHVDHISQCLDSILEQECDFDFEIVLGEDGSNDGTQEICKEYARRFPDIIRLEIRDQKKKVYLYGRATGKHNLLKVMQEGKGDYFAFCDGDDYWTDKKKLQKQVDFMEANRSYSFCATDRMIFLEGKKIRDKHLQKAFVDSNGLQIVITKDNFYRPCLVYSSTILFRKKCLDFNLMEERFKEVKDDFIYYSLLSRGKGIVQPWITSDYRIHDGGRWSSLSRFSMAKMNHHTARGMYHSYLGKDRQVQDHYQDTLLSYFVESVKNRRWKDIGISLREKPAVLLKVVFKRIPMEVLKLFKTID